MKKTNTRKCLNCKCTALRNTQVVCSAICGYEYAKKIKVKQLQKDKKEAKERMKTLSEWLKDLEKEINKTVRLIDFGHGCMSCGGFKTPQAGHLHSVKAHPELRFHLENIWVQDTYCNVHKSGNQLKYIEGIKTIYGAEYSEYLQRGLIANHRSLKLTIPEIKEVLPIVKDTNKKLEKKSKIYSKEDRVLLRVYFNQLFGIYK